MIITTTFAHSVAFDLLTLLKHNNDLFMLLASINRVPTAPVFFTFSEPAKSTKCNVETISSLVDKLR